MAGAKTKLSVYDLEKNGALQWTYVGAAGSMVAPNGQVILAAGLQVARNSLLSQRQAATP